MKKSVTLLIILLFLLLTGCTAQQAKVESETQDQPVTVRLEGGDWGYPQPFTHYSRGPGYSKMYYIFDSLLEKDEKGLIPWLAEKWEVGEDGKSFLFTLRPDINWHDGKALTAHDVAFSFQYYQQHHPVRIHSLVIDPTYLIRIEALTDQEVLFEVAESQAPFLEALGMVPIIPKHIWANIADPKKFIDESALIGSGPYQLTEYNKEQGLYRFQAYQDFWGPAAQVDVLEFIPVGDSILALEKGEIHLADVPADLEKRFEERANITLMEKPGYYGYRLIFNMERQPEFQSKEMRQAFAYAIDRQELVQKTARGAAVAGSMGIVPPHHRWFHSNLPTYDVDLEKSLQLLSKAKEQGNEILKEPLKYQLLVGADLEVRIGEVLKEQLHKVGIQLDVVAADNKSRDSRIVEGNYQIALVGHGGWGGDPDYLRVRFASDLPTSISGKVPGYANEQVTELALRQLKEIDDEKRRDTIMQLQEILAKEVAEIPLYFTTGKTAYRHDIYGGWLHAYDHHNLTHNKLSFLAR
ncbi:ABC transporter substrate-binding protein [Heliorestis convoluta]|uniref:Extracellular solute-binding protein, family 5 Middle n=1 Tax=Heliorestis convoluta TaxID=356322 RepID=A0A5Q2N586_9FIRM|nr:ABC transporter substrate-binding protein [Heliorestis convoluta]QGG49059.1 Extracellular solute-binding protein, family 5 Middle [Heliorestis convoluta]